MNNEVIKQIFQSSFDYKRYCTEIVNKIFGCTDIATSPEPLDTTAEGDECYYIGRMTDADGRELGFFYTRMASGSDVRRKRVGLRKLIAPYLKYDVDAAIAVFADNRHWRFSYICDMKEGSTAAKRFSYILGEPKGQYKTPIERLSRIASASAWRLSDIRDAFSVDALSKEFFDEYHRHYDIIVDELKRQGLDSAAIHDYVKKMMGRIVFLHFLQKKGWLNNNPVFLRDLFFFSPHQTDFLEQVLEPLFFGIFNTEKANRQKLFADNQWDIDLLEDWRELPYLNGGLFERDSIDDLNITLPASLFEDLFNFMASYNFTVDENDPDDAEVGVDPEMLGKIFESLLEDNKAKGAFYTPKEIVRYMCKESLIAYLGTQASRLHADETSALHAIRTFVETHEMQPDLEPYRDILDKALREVKICDPAIGSGAFPMGLLNELWRCREALSDSFVSQVSVHRSQLKKEIIENNIYGVDIEKGAIDIARLRFWLSIVVDAETPEPLPNFDYKFMQGNSLIESFDGFDLSGIAGRPAGRQSASAQLIIGLDSKSNQRNLHRLIKDYFTVTDHRKKADLRQGINDEVKSLITNSIGTSASTQQHLSRLDVSANQDFFLWHTWFKDIFDKGGFDIVIGNPPYNGISHNNNESIRILIEDYKKEPGTQISLKERKLWLQDDYVKFIRKMEDFIEYSPKSILAFINNSSFIDNPTFRGMRWHLLNTFDNISILDLHGNTRKSNATNLGKKDENVFNIMQGVSINIFQKKKQKKEKCLAKIRHAEVIGTRKQKKDILNTGYYALSFQDISPVSPFYFFIPQNRQGVDVYDSGFEIQKLMPVCVTGIVTARDGLVIDIDPDNLLKKIEFFADIKKTDAEVRNCFFGKKKSTKYLPGDSRGWKLVEARQAIQKHNIKDNIIPFAFRVLDNRFVYYSPDMVDWGREDIYQKHVLQKYNYCLVVPRQTTKDWKHVFVTNKVANFNFLATGGQNGAGTHFPLYLYDCIGNRTPNISDEIWSKINRIIGYETSAEELFDYVYGVLHSKEYRKANMEFLKKDFPKIPYPKNISYYQGLSEIGRKLRNLHLFQELPPKNLITSFVGDGDNVISRIQFQDNKVYINNQQFFNNISEDVWTFEIGDDQPAKRWLKERKGMVLRSKDVEYYQQLIYILHKTAIYMKLIDEIRE